MEKNKKLKLKKVEGFKREKKPKETWTNLLFGGLRLPSSSWNFCDIKVRR